MAFIATSTTFRKPLRVHYHNIEESHGVASLLVKRIEMHLG
jgi:hypothetical protein